MSKKKYQVIYSDPPWDYNGQTKFLGKSKHSSAKHHYPTMTVPDMIEEFTPQIEEWADDDCLLYMWTSSPHLDQAITLGEAWGFDYKTVAFVWNKVLPNPGFYTMSDTELCLVFKKKGGKIPKPRGARNIRQTFTSSVEDLETMYLEQKRKEHSRKPMEFRHRIDEMFPQQNKMEMFARTTLSGWDVFGNETEKFDSQMNILNLIEEIEDEKPSN